MESYKVKEKHCLELIAADIKKNDGTISYPSTLGEDCSTETKLQLILFLVCITYTKIYRLRSFNLFCFLGNNVYERSIVVSLHPIDC